MEKMVWAIQIEEKQSNEGSAVKASLIGCPFCGEMMRAYHRVCPHCRESIRPPARTQVLGDQISQAKPLTERSHMIFQAYLGGAQLRGACLGGADLFDADLAAADLRGADLTEANLSGADLSGADLRRANLQYADLSDANLSGADLTGANLLHAILERARYDGFTIWPANFDPGALGAVHQGELRRRLL